MTQNIYAIFKRELGAYFNSAIAYIFIIVFLLVNSVLYMSSFFITQSADMRSFFGLMPIILVVFLPAITMRLWAEDKKSGTIELLMTFPMPSYQIVLGKFLAGYLFFLVSLAGTLTIPAMLSMVGNPDMGPISGGYFGTALMGAFYLAVGIFVSGISKDQIVAFIVAMVVCFVLYISGTPFIAIQIDGWIPGLGTFISNYIGLAQHFSAIERGILDIKDIVYFISMAALFLFLNGLSLKDRFKPGAGLRFALHVAVMASLVLFFQVVMAGINIGRFDLTENKVFSVSPSGLKILSRLKVPVQLKYYVSPKEKMPSQFNSLEDDVIGKLEEFSLASGGLIEYEVVRVEGIGQFEEAQGEEKQEDFGAKLSAKGVQPFQVQTLENDELAIKVIFSSISIGYKEKKDEIMSKIIPAGLGNMEYELLSKIFRMIRDKKPVVAIHTPFFEQQVDSRMVALYKQMGQDIPGVRKEDDYKYLPQILERDGYVVDKIAFDRKEPIPDDMDTLVVVATEPINERQKYEINKALYLGKNVILAAQKYYFDYESGKKGVRVSAVENKTTVNELLKSYGLGIDESLLMDDNHQVISISKGQSQGIFQVMSQHPVKLPIQIILNDSSLNQNVSITSWLSSLFYLWGGAVQMDEEKLKTLGLKSTILMTSSAKSWKVPYHAGYLTQKDFDTPVTFKGNFPLAVLVEGEFPDAFQGQERPKWTPKKDEVAGHDAFAAAMAKGKDAKKEEEKPEKPETPYRDKHKPGKLLLLACGEMFKDSVLSGGSGNMALFLNSVDALTLGNELINVRGKMIMDRRIPKLDKGQKLTYRFFTTAMLPLLFALIGIARWFFKKKARESYLRTIGEMRGQS